MNKRALGKTGLEISEISFGTVSLGIPYGIGVKNRNDMIPPQEAVKLLLTAVDKGINFFDTARSYGESENILGKAFEGCRSKVVICTKPVHIYDGYAGQRLPDNAQIKKMLTESLNKSLNELQTDYIDVLMSHDCNIEFMENPVVTEFFQDAKNKGIIRATGISTYTVEQSLNAIKSGLWDVIQLPFNLMQQEQLAVFELAHQHHIGLIIRSALLKGVLTNRINDIHPELKRVKEHAEQYKTLFNGNIKSLSDLATKFVLSFDEISSVLLGIDKLEYLESALKVVDGNYLDRQTRDKAVTMPYPDPNFIDLQKWARMGWL